MERAAAAASLSASVSLPSKGDQRAVRDDDVDNNIPVEHEVRLLLTRLGPNHEVKPGLYLVLDAVSREDEIVLLKQISRAEESWRDLRHRRVQCHGGDPIKNAPRPPLAPWLRTLADDLRLTGCVDFDVNHVLINEYPAQGGGVGIMPHTDGPLYVPRTCCLSLGGACDLVFEPRLSTSSDALVGSVVPGYAELALTLELPSRSLVIFTNRFYTDALHSVHDVRGATRMSLTLRRILDDQNDAP